MGGGTWTSTSFTSYSTSVGKTVSNGVVLNNNLQDLYRSRNLQPELNPYNVMRECCDSAEHPNTIPVILGLDVTGSMGSGAMEVSKKLNVVMTQLYEQVTDVEFLVMGIGDLAYDRAPIQTSQFESDIRIAEQLDKVYFEGGGGGNNYESYTAAWYFGLRHTKLDCWKRGQKGIIITTGDEPLNPYLPKTKLTQVFGDNLQSDVSTDDLYKSVIEKFDIYHLAVNDISTSYSYYADRIASSWGKYLDNEHLRIVTLDNIVPTIVSIIVSNNTANDTTFNTTQSDTTKDNVLGHNIIKW